MAIVRGLERVMSKVVSFRLNKENPREAQAYEILGAWRANGHSTRYTVTEALLKLGELRTDSSPGAALDGISDTLNQVRRLLEEIEYRGSSSQKSNDTSHHPSGLTDDFVTSVKKAAKPGMALD